MTKSPRFVPILIVLLVIALLFAAFLITAMVTSAMGYGISVGNLYFWDEKVFLVDGNTSMIVSDQSKKLELFSGYSNGDKIILIHDGVEETLPAHTGGYFAVRVSKGDGSYKPSDNILGIVRVEEPTCTEEAQLSGPLDFTAQYVRTNGYNEGVAYPVVTVIRTVKELNEYYNANKDKYYLERQHNVYSDTTIGFLDACDKYDDNFFSEKALILILLEEGSGSVRHTVRQVSATGNTVCVEIDSHVPETFTDDMAEWHIIIEVDNNIKPRYTTDFTIYMDGRLMTDDEWIEMQPIDDTAAEVAFSFSLTWNTYGISSYDSVTGKLVKTTDATEPERYVTSYKLTEEQREEIYALIEKLDIVSYPDVYDPHNGKLVSEPSMTLILSVKADSLEKTVRAEGIALTYEAENRKGQRFLEVCKSIRDILVETDEWKALPEYEFFYD